MNETESAQEGILGGFLQYDMSRTGMTILYEEPSALDAYTHAYVASAALVGAAATAGIAIAVEGGEGLVVFRTTHYASDLLKIGLSPSEVESLVLKEVKTLSPELKVGDYVKRTIVVSGKELEYRLKVLEDGVVNVGTIFEKWVK